MSISAKWPYLLYLLAAILWLSGIILDNALGQGIAIGSIFVFLIGDCSAFLKGLGYVFPWHLYA